ncbi:hypothetical protein T484DRAFT_1910696 [Baffinella frigidus]|nr:hypothetical protein T484DRAFT_1910696 [Cryptophyta sp. CCMP2293]
MFRSNTPGDNATRLCLTGTALFLQIDNPWNLEQCDPPNSVQSSFITAEFCPESYCQEWTCSCYDPARDTGILGSTPTVNQVAGTAECSESCDDGMQRHSGPAYDPDFHGGSVPFYPCCHDLARCKTYNGSAAECEEGAVLGCLAEEGVECPPYGTAEDCGVHACCTPWLAAGSEEPPPPPGEDGGSMLCQVSSDAQAETLDFSCTIAGGVTPDGTLATYTGSLDTRADHTSASALRDAHPSTAPDARTNSDASRDVTRTNSDTTHDPLRTNSDATVRKGVRRGHTCGV